MHGDGTVRLVVSKGPAPVEVPDFEGRPVFAATQALDAAGFLVKPPNLQFSTTQPQGTVLDQKPDARQTVPAESSVTLTVSNGPPPVDVPDLQGSTFSDAVSQLVAVHLTPKRGADQFSDTVKKGRVIATEPAAGKQAAYDSTVIVHLSKGPDLVLVPDVIGTTIEDASRALQNRGLVADPLNYRPGHYVLRESPRAGDKVPRGSTVKLRLD
jgi:eukaryotic-like serine/threonine-protein kinase